MITHYPLQEGQLMIVRPNKFGLYEEMSKMMVLLHKVISSKEGIMAKCSYTKEQKEFRISIPLFLLWRIADDEDLLEMHENYIHSKNIQKKNRA